MRFARRAWSGQDGTWNVLSVGLGTAADPVPVISSTISSGLANGF
ncbi:MAG: hypothetical protein AAF127_12640 [Pseudomonadota bacterium]